MSTHNAGRQQDRRSISAPPILSRAWLRSLLDRDAGQSLVEVAILFPVLILLLIGAVEFGRLTYAGMAVTNAAHAGVQYGAQNHITALDNAGMQQAATTDGKKVSGISASGSHFCACSNGAASTCLPTDCSGARIIEYVRVNTSATVNPLFHYPGSPATFNLTGQATMRVQQ
jgi:Flp pilus assembly protein TadG